MPARGEPAGRHVDSTAVGAGCVAHSSRCLSCCATIGLESLYDFCRCITTGVPVETVLAITKGCGVLVPAARAAVLTVSIHESDELDQTFLGSIRPDAQRGSRS